MPIIRSWRVLYRWSLPVVFGALVFKLSVWCGGEGCVSGLRAAALLLKGVVKKTEEQLNQDEEDPLASLMWKESQTVHSNFFNSFSVY